MVYTRVVGGGSYRAQSSCNSYAIQILALTLLHIHTLPGGPCPGSVPCGAAGWPAAGGMANGVVRLALAKSR